jgi:hypothetical protein
MVVGELRKYKCFPNFYMNENVQQRNVFINMQRFISARTFKKVTPRFYTLPALHIF